MIAYNSVSDIPVPEHIRTKSWKKFFNIEKAQPPHRAAPTSIYPPPGNGRVSNEGTSIYVSEYTDNWLLVPTVT